jgi:hypothetical protein
LTGLTWSDIPSLAFTQGSLKNTVFQLNCSAVAHDILNSLSLVNLGTAKAGTDISALWLYYSATGNSATATSVGQFTSAGSSTWSLAGLSHQAADGSSYFLLADIAPAATLGTTCQFSLPANQAQFQISGNFPTITFTNTYSQVINAFFMPEISADLNSAAVFRMVKGEASVPLAQIRLTNFTNHAVTLNSLQLALQAKEGSNLSPASLFTTLRLLQNQAVAATLAAPITSGGLFTFTPAITLPAQTQQALELQADLTTAPTEKHFRFALLDNQCLNQGQTLSQAVSGKSFPLATSVFSIYDPQLTSTFSNYPNPFSPSQGGTKIGYYLPQDAQIKLTLWTLDHRLVKTLINEKQPAGMMELAWDGRNGEGNQVRNGVYVLVLDCNYTAGGHESLTRKVAVAK